MRPSSQGSSFFHFGQSGRQGGGPGRLRRGLACRRFPRPKLSPLPSLVSRRVLPGSPVILASSTSARAHRAVSCVAAPNRFRANTRTPRLAFPNPRFSPNSRRGDPSRISPFRRLQFAHSAVAFRIPMPARSDVRAPGTARLAPAGPPPTPPFVRETRARRVRNFPCICPFFLGCARR